MLPGQGQRFGMTLHSLRFFNFRLLMLIKFCGIVYYLLLCGAEETVQAESIYTDYLMLHKSL